MLNAYVAEQQHGAVVALRRITRESVYAVKQAVGHSFQRIFPLYDFLQRVPCVVAAKDKSLLVYRGGYAFCKYKEHIAL